MKFIIPFALSAVLLLSCNDTTKETSEHKEAISQTKKDTAKVSKDLGLNSGDKWAVNDEMKPHVLKGEELVNSYITSKGTDFKNLAKEVKDQNSQLIKSCTMDGKSHDELHKWLHPHLELTKALEEEQDASKAENLISQLQTSYQTYHQYFK